MTKSNELNVPPRPIVHLGNDRAAHPVANLSEVVRPSGRRMMELAPALSRDRPGHQLGSFPSWIMTKLMPTFVADDPVVEVFVRGNVDRSGVHRAAK